jgi:hypothetical protein
MQKLRDCSDAEAKVELEANDRLLGAIGDTRR